MGHTGWQHDICLEKEDHISPKPRPHLEDPPNTSSATDEYFRAAEAKVASIISGIKNSASPPICPHILIVCMLNKPTKQKASAKNSSGQ